MSEPFFHVLKSEGLAAFVEQKSRFIGRARPISEEAEALQFLEELRRTEWDASHHCYAYILREPPATRHSDNGEPQGTAGLPILNVLSHADLYNVCCVVTRYFGGILLGTGGLTRAYSRAAREAIEAAGLACMGRWRRVGLAGAYCFYDQLLREIESFGAVVEETAYSEAVSLTCWVRAERCDAFCDKVIYFTSGAIVPEKGEEQSRAIAVGEGTPNL